MSTTSVEEKKITRKSTREPKKPKKSQIPFGILLIIGLLFAGIHLESLRSGLGVHLAFGVAFGYILQRSRFCFTAGFRDPCITGNTSITRATLVAFAVGSVGFAAIKIGADGALDMVGVNPIGIPLMVGGTIFGIGMVIAGGCASGTFMRIGEGFVLQLIALVFFVIGSMWGVRDMNLFWSNFEGESSTVFLPDVFGWLGAIFVQFLIIVLLYIAATKWQEKRMGTKE